MRVLIDTNVLGRLSQPDHPHCLIAQRSLDRLRKNRHELRLVPQILYEYWVVATRSADQNGLGFSMAQVQSRLQAFKSLFPPLRDERGILESWETIVVAHAVLGKNAHDARLVAAMRRHGLSHLLTFDAADFRRYDGIELLEPQSIAAASI